MKSVLKLGKVLYLLGKAEGIYSVWPGGKNRLENRECTRERFEIRKPPLRILSLYLKYWYDNINNQVIYNVVIMLVEGMRYQSFVFIL